MKKFIFITALFLFTSLLFAQESEGEISLTLSNNTVKEAIDQLESITEYQFYFDQKWLDSETVILSESFLNKPLQDILNSIFSKTDLNFYITEKSVILTKNVLIYDKLPDNFYTHGSDSENTFTPDNIAFFKDGNPTDKKTEQHLSVIGKQSNTSTEKTFELTGYIKEAKTGKPISYVVLKTADGKHTTTTDEEGFYKIKLPKGVNNLETESFLHMPSKSRIAIYNNGKLNFSLSENINQLKEIVVKGKKTETLKSANTGVTSINIEGIKNIPMVLGERDILKAATIIPGVKTTGEGSSGFNVRGGKTDQNLILLDGATIYNPAHFFGFFSAINPYTIQSAEIYKGSIPASYGGRLASVFDITSKKLDLKKVTGEGGIGPVTSNLAVTTPIIKEKSALLVAGRATYSDWILKTLDEESLKNSKASFYDIQLKYSHLINENNSIDATGYFSKDVFNISSDSLYRYENRLMSVKWNHTFSPKHKSELLASGSEYKFNINYDKAEDPNKSFDYGYKINELQLFYKGNYTLNDKHTITYGATGKLYNSEPGYLNPKTQESELQKVRMQNEKALENALFISDSYKISDKLMISAGLRFSMFSALGKRTQRVYDSNLPVSDESAIETKNYGNNEIIKTYTGLEPRVSARYFITDDISVKASFDRTYQYLHLLSNNTTQSPTDAWKLSDLNIKPQNSDQFSIGLFKNFAEKEIEVSLEGYIKRINNILDYRTGASLLLNDNIETEILRGEGKAHGIEFMLKKETGRLNGWLGYTYSRTFVKLDSKFESDKVNNGNYFPANFDKPHDISVILNYRLTKRYSLSSNFIYQTGRPITYPIGKYSYGGSEYTAYSDRNAFRVPDYYRLDLGINIEGNHKIKKLAHSFWNISVYNVLGRNNPYSIFFVTKGGNIKAYQTSIFSVPVPTISYNFKF